MISVTQNELKLEVLLQPHRRLFFNIPFSTGTLPSYDYFTPTFARAAKDILQKL